MRQVGAMTRKSTLRCTCVVRECTVWSRASRLRKRRRRGLCGYAHILTMQRVQPQQVHDLNDPGPARREPLRSYLLQQEINFNECEIYCR